MLNKNLAKVIQAQPYQQAMLAHVPSNFKGAVGHVMCQLFRETNGNLFAASQLLKKKIDHYKNNKGVWQDLAKIQEKEPEVLKKSLFYYFYYEELTFAEKEQYKKDYSSRASSVPKYPPLPSSPSSNSSEEEWLSWFNQLVVIQQERNYKKGWLFYQLKHHNAPRFLYQKNI